MTDSHLHPSDTCQQRIGVCSWSLQASSPVELVERVRACGLSHVQLALDPIRTGAWNFSETADALERANIRILSGMMGFKGEDYSTLDSILATGGVRLDADWDENLRAAHENAQIAKQFGLSLITFHAGFLPHDQHDAVRTTMLDRLRRIVDVFAQQHIRVAFETGQESAATLLDVLAEHGFEHVGVNFDPANMILYGMGDPVAALHRLRDRVAQIHIKDATAATTSGTWGTEVPVGAGDVDWQGVLNLASSLHADLVIEREAGSQRIEDICTAKSLLDTCLHTD
ncbi:MAG: sugar phosphate isomerase/epimerase [Phycisphaeraceae bacterium]|nr:sugar phosphate isomerase/epimerase [Phycisphaerales bacterium]MCB9860188.1 sugar phosphate isomerase/epimerase [Phycisphaeraceae bacterium]